MTPEAQRILDVFRSRGLRARGFIHFTDFGNAIVWEAGYVRDEAVRKALASLIGDGYVREMSAGLELSEPGEKYLYGEQQPKHGARVYQVGDKILVKQTVLCGTPAEYVIDDQRERHVGADDDAAIAAAIRDALSGSL